MDPREFQGLASQLSLNANPASCRSAISRAYYAIHHVAADFIRSGSITISKGSSSHGEVIKFLGNCGDEDVETVGSKLSDFQGERVAADYHLDDMSVEENKSAELWVKLAGKLITDLDNYHADADRHKKISQNIQKWKNENNYIR
jgi:hypothetical protein